MAKTATKVITGNVTITVTTSATQYNLTAYCAPSGTSSGVSVGYCDNYLTDTRGTQLFNIAGDNGAGPKTGVIPAGKYLYARSFHSSYIKPDSYVTGATLVGKRDHGRTSNYFEGENGEVWFWQPTGTVTLYVSAYGGPDTGGSSCGSDCCGD